MQVTTVCFWHNYVTRLEYRSQRTRGRACHRVTVALTTTRNSMGCVCVLVATDRPPTLAQPLAIHTHLPYCGVPNGGAVSQRARLPCRNETQRGVNSNFRQFIYKFATEYGIYDDGWSVFAPCAMFVYDAL